MNCEKRELYDIFYKDVIMARDMGDNKTELTSSELHGECILTVLDKHIGEAHAHALRRGYTHVAKVCDNKNSCYDVYSRLPKPL